VVANNYKHNSNSDVSEYIMSLGNNFIGSVHTSQYVSNTNDIFGDPFGINIAHQDALQLYTVADPEVGPLVYPMDHMAIFPLKPDSPLIDMATCFDIDLNPVYYDQRNYNRPLTNCDTGSAEYSEQIYFASMPEKNIEIQVGEAFSYSIAIFSNASPIEDISIISGENWLELINKDLSNGNALLYGVPDFLQVGEHQVIIKTENASKSITQVININVLHYFEDFENTQLNDHSCLLKVNDEADSGSTWVIGAATAYNGKKSIYISGDEGLTNEHSSSESHNQLILPLDLTHILNPQLSFYWKCESFTHFDDGFPKNYGELVISDSQGLTKILTPFNDQATWTLKTIDLSLYSGRKINLQFKWDNYYTYYKYITPAFSIDDIVVKGQATEKLIVTSKPQTVIGANQEYVYPLKVNVNNDAEIKSVSTPGFLSLTGKISEDTAILSGTPTQDDIKTHSVIIEFENSAGVTTLSYSLDVLCFYENFESDTSNWLVTGESPYTDNNWMIGTGSSPDNNHFAYVSYNNFSPFFRLDKTSIVYLSYPVEILLKHIQNPKLVFQWQCLALTQFDSHSDYGFGEVYIEDINNNINLVSLPKEFVYSSNQGCEEKIIDLSEYEGSIKHIIFKWENHGEGYGSSIKTAFNLDNIQIKGELSKAPVFQSRPEPLKTVVNSNESFSYTIMVSDINQNDKIHIACESCPDWLTLTQQETPDGIAEAILTSVGKIAEGLSNEIILSASDGTFTTNQSFTLYSKSEDIEYRFQQMWPMLSNQWYFNTPSDIAMDSSNFVYIADSGNHRIVKFSDRGVFRKSWGRKGNKNGEFNKPTHIAIGPDDHVFVVDSGNVRIQEFDSDGNFVKLIIDEDEISNKYVKISGLAVDSEGNIYYGIIPNNQWRLVKQSPGGNKTTLVYESVHLFQVQAIEVDVLGNVYVVDKKIGHFYKFDASGSLIFDKDLEFNGIALDKSGYLYLTDDTNYVYQYDVHGDFEKSFSAKGDMDKTDDETKPYGISVSSDRNIYITAYTTFNEDRAENSDDPLSRETIKVFTNKGEKIKEWNCYGKEINHFYHPTGIAADNENNLFICDSHNSRIQIYNQDQGWSSWGKYGDNEGEFIYPYACTFDSNDYIYITDYKKNRIQKCQKDGQNCRTIKSGLNNPTGIAVDHEDNIYVADSSNYQILKMNSQGNVLHSWGEQGNDKGQFEFPNFISTLQINNKTILYITDSINKRVQKFDTDGNYMTEWNEHLSYPCGIAVDKNGDVFIADINKEDHISQLIQFDIEGRFIRQTRVDGFGPASIRNPTGVAIGNDNTIWLTDNRLSRVQQFKRIRLTEGVTKAIVVAARQYFEKDNLWPAFESNAQTAKWVLESKGIYPDDILYLSSYNSDDDKKLTWDNLIKAIEEWPLTNTIADSLIIYLAGHGETGQFILNEGETIDVSHLKTAFNNIQQNIKGNIILIVDSCYSGSLLESLKHDHYSRIILTSADKGEKANYTGYGHISYSSMFWSNISNGKSILDAHNAAALVMKTYNQNNENKQNAQIYYNYDDAIMKEIYIGNEILSGNHQVSIINSELTTDNSETASLTVFIQAEDYNNLNVFAYIHHDTSLNDSLISTPELDLVQKGQGIFTGRFEEIYQDESILIFAEDNNGHLIFLDKIIVEDFEDANKAIIISGYVPPDDLMKQTIQTGILSAINALKKQWFLSENIRLFCPDQASYNECYSSFDLDILLDKDWTQKANDLVIYLVGKRISTYGFLVDKDQFLLDTQLISWINGLDIKGQVCLVYDACNAGNFQQLFVDSINENTPNCIILTSTGKNKPVCISETGDISFSNLFWKEIFKGNNVKDAFKQSKSTTDAFSGYKQKPDIKTTPGKLEDIYNSEDLYIGRHVITADIENRIVEVSPFQSISDIYASITATVSSNNEITSVNCIIVPPGLNIDFSNDFFDVCNEKLSIFQMNQTINNEFEFQWDQFEQTGIYNIFVYSVDYRGKMTPFKNTKVIKETDGLPENANVLDKTIEQEHYFISSEDQDWFKFYAAPNRDVYTIKVEKAFATNNLSIRLYKENDLNTPFDEYFLKDDKNEIRILYPGIYLPDDGMIIYIQIENLSSTTRIEETEYKILLFHEHAGNDDGKIYGKIIDKITKEPIGGAKIRNDSLGKEAISKDDGSYILAETPLNISSTITIHREKYHSESKNIPALTKAAASTTVNFELRPYNTLTIDMPETIHTGESISVCVSLLNFNGIDKELPVQIRLSSNSGYNKVLGINVTNNMLKICDTIILTAKCSDFFEITAKTSSFYNMKAYTKKSIVDHCCDNDVTIEDAICALKLFVGLETSFNYENDMLDNIDDVIELKDLILIMQIVSENN
jgi:sugar lactone lactonase YvrE